MYPHTTLKAYKHENKLSWDFRLVALKVLGKVSFFMSNYAVKYTLQKHVDVAVSSSKLVHECKAAFLDGYTADPMKKQRAGVGSSANN